MLKYMQLDLLKESLESLGIDFGYNTNEVEYRNYMVNNPIVIEEVHNDPAGGIDGMLGGNPPTLTSGEQKANGEKIISILMSDLSLTKEQAAGVVGVIVAESGANPGAFNKGERNGTYRSSSANNTGGAYGTKGSAWSYGAGICQWTFCDRKEKALMLGLGVSREQAINIIKTQGIESLPLEQQAKMLVGELRNTYKATLEGIRKCSTASQAAATYYCHSVAGFSSSREPASQAEINKMNAKYSKVGATSQINKGMSFAEGFMK